MGRPKTMGSRRMVSLPDDTLAELEAYMARTGSTKEAETIRKLLKDGLMLHQPAEDLLNACKAAYEGGRSLGWIYAHMLEQHPKVLKSTIQRQSLWSELRGDEYLVFDSVEGWHIMIGRSFREGQEMSVDEQITELDRIFSDGVPHDS